MWDKFKGGIVLCLFGLIIVSVYFGYHALAYNRDNDAIYEKMAEMNAEVVSIEVETTGVGTPFYVKLDGDRIYKIIYIVDGEEKTGYAKMNALDYWIFK